MALGGLLLVACDAPSLAPSPTDPPRQVTTTTLPETVTTVAPEAGAEDFRVCLGIQGIDIAPIPLDAQGRPRLDLVMRDLDLSSPDTVAALDVCAERLVAGPLFMGETHVREEVVATLVEFAGCMRSRGVPDFPEPVAGFHGLGFPFPPDEIPYEDPDLVAAIAECRERILPG